MGIATNAIAEIRDRNYADTVEIVDTNWDSNGTLKVTVRELIGEASPGVNRMRQARRLARRALMYPENTRSSAVIREFYADGSTHWTFAVSRHERY